MSTGDIKWDQYSVTLSSPEYGVNILPSNIFSLLSLCLIFCFILFCLIPLKSTQPFSSLLHPYFPQPLPIGYLDNKLSHTYVDSSVQNPILRSFSWEPSCYRLLYSQVLWQKGTLKLGNWGGLKRWLFTQQAALGGSNKDEQHPVLSSQRQAGRKGAVSRIQRIM